VGRQLAHKHVGGEATYANDQKQWDEPDKNERPDNPVANAIEDTVSEVAQQMEQEVRNSDHARQIADSNHDPWEPSTEQKRHNIDGKANAFPKPPDGFPGGVFLRQ
jgi:hypothetical protein